MKVTDLLNEAPIEPTGDPNDPMIYGHNKANPGSLKYRIMRARAQLKDLAQEAESDDLVVWERITKLFPELQMNIEQVQHGIEELVKQRRKGGIKSKGINKGIGE